MRRFSKISKPIVSLLVCLALIVSGLPTNLGTTAAKADENSITVSSGMLNIEAGETITKDIYITDRASVYVRGKVTGTIYVQTTDFCDLHEEEDGFMWTPENLNVDGAAEISEVVFSGKARVYIDGTVHKMSYESGCTIDGGLSENGHADSIYINGAESVFCEGSVDTVYIMSGEFFLATNSYARNVFGIGGRFNNYGSVDYLQLTGEATASNWLPEDGVPGVDAYIKFVYLEGNSHTDPSYDSLPEIFENFGTVDSVVGYGSFIINFGTIHNLWAKGGRIDLDSGLSGSGNDGETYSVEQFYSTGAYIYANLTENPSRTRIVKDAVINGGECNFASALFENLTFNTLPSAVLMNGETNIKNLTILDEGDSSEKDVWLNDRSKQYIENLSVTPAFEQNSSLKILQLFGLATGEETFEEFGIEDEEIDFETARDNYYQQLFESAQSQNLYSVAESADRNPNAQYAMSTGMGAANIRKTFASASGIVLDGTGSVNSAAGSISGDISNGAQVCLDASAEAWFAFDIADPGKYTVSVSAGSAEAYAMLVLPDETVMAGAINGSDTISATTFTTGKGYVAVYGAETPATVKLSRQNVHYFNPEFEYAEIDEVTGKTKYIPVASDTVSYEIRDDSTGRTVTNMRRTEKGLVLSDTLDGHSLSVSAKPYNDEKYTSAHAQFTYDSDSDTGVKAVMYEYGLFSGSLNGSNEVSIYIYDDQGNYCQTAEIRDNWFTTSHLPNGQYTAIFIKDRGDYCFGTLSEYDTFGFNNHEDYIRDTFEIKLAEAARYYNVSVPEIKPRECKYIDTAKTDLRLNAEVCVPDTLVTLILEYALLPGNISNAEAVITLINGTRLEGDSIVLDNKTSTDFSVSGNTIKIPLGKNTDGKLSLCISGGEDTGRIGATAQIGVTADGFDTTEFAGSAAIDVVLLTINAPEYTSQSDIYVYGKALPDSFVRIFDGGEEIGSVNAKAGGGYGLHVPLSGGTDVYEHNVYAVLETEDRTVTSPIAKVKRNSFAPTLESFVMHYAIHGEETVLSLTGEEFVSKEFLYFYWPGTIYTFEIELSSAEAITDVYMGSNSDGVRKEIKANYDSASGKWIASGVFSEDTGYLPEHFYIRYEAGNAANVAENIVSATGSVSDNNEAYDYFINYTQSDAYKNAVENGPSVTELYSLEDEDGYSDLMLLESEELGMACLLETNLQFSIADLDENALLEEGYIKVEDEDNGTLSFVRYVQNEETGEFEAYIIDVNHDPELYDVFKEASIDTPGLRLAAMSTTSENDSSGENLSTLEKSYGLTKLVANNYGWMYYTFNGSIMNPVGKIGKGLVKGAEIFGKVSGIADKLERGYKAYKDSEYYQKMKDDIQKKSDYLRQMLEALEKQKQENPENTCFPNLGEMGDLIDKFEKDGMAAADGASANIWGKYFMDMSLEISFDLIGGKVAKGAGKVTGKSLEWLKKQKGGTTIRKGASGAADTAAGFLFGQYAGLYEKYINSMIESFNPAYIADGSNAGLDDLSNAIQGKLEECFPTPSPTPTPTLSPSPSDNPPPPPGDPGDPNKNRGGSGGSGGTINGNSKTVEDPSGFVYAGVPENRISGVTCQVYYKDEAGNAVLWNAEEYDQINPQITDPSGVFFWMVPKGEWKVVCTADGYEPYETEWLRVPPPQTEVYINLISVYAPKIKNFTVNTKYALVEFDMYVRTDSMTKADIKLTDANGKPIKYDLVPVTESNPELAKEYMLVFDESGVADGNEYNISIPEGILGYNEKAMESAYSGIVKASIATAEDENLLIEHTPQNTDGISPWWFILAAVLIAAIAVPVTVLLIKKRKTKTNK